MNLKEWIEIANRATSGDMVWDILRDWEKSLLSNPTGLVRVEKCKACDGFGKTKIISEAQCPKCNGTGFIRTDLTADEAAKWLKWEIEQYAKLYEGAYVELPDGSRIELKEKYEV